MGTYLGLFNGTICLPQIVAAVVGGLILKVFTVPGQLAPEIFDARCCWRITRSGSSLCKLHQTP